MDDGERIAFTHAANGSASLRLTTTEQALSDARFIGPDVTHLLRDGDIAGAANRDFVRGLLAKMPPGERGGLMAANGELSAVGANRLRAALVARAYGDPGVIARAFEHVDSNIKTIASALTDSSAPWIKMRDAVARGELAAGNDITDGVMQAVKSIMLARDTRRPVGEVMAQGDIFTSDVSQLAARLFFKDSEMKRFLSKAAMGENLSTFARNIVSGAEKGADMFGAPPPTAIDVLKGTIAASDRRVAALIEAAQSSEAIAKAVVDPKVHEAMEAQLERNISQGRNRVPSAEDGADGSLGFADKEMHDASMQMKLADEVKACSTVAPKGTVE
jgi:hypothetical protein